MIVEVTEFHVFMQLQNYQKSQATLTVMPEAYDPEPHLASTINVETYYFQIGCLRNLPTVVKQNYLICHYSCLCLHYHKKYRHNRMPVPLIPLETVTT